jgi:pyruvate dehydrogenase kinase 2/3/4
MPTQIPIAFPVVSFGFSGLIKRAHQAVWPVFEDDMWKPSERLMETIRHYASFPATGVSLRQMVQFGDRPSTGTLFRASQFLSEELPIRLAHRVQDLGELPDGLSEMPSIKKVQDWYAQSFEV